MSNPCECDSGLEAAVVVTVQDENGNEINASELCEQCLKDPLIKKAFDSLGIGTVEIP